MERLVVLYGSQTGTSQEVAERIGRDALRLQIPSTVLAMDDFPVQKLIQEKFVVFVCSTTGQGEEPDNMKKFWRFLLRRSLPANSLVSTNFGVLGLGDSSYSRFNFVAKRLHRRILQLGGNPLLDVGLADDQHDLGGDFVVESWIKDFWKVPLVTTLIPPGVEALDPEKPLPPRFVVEAFHSSPQQQGGSGQRGILSQESTNSWDARHPFHGKVIRNVRVTSMDHFQDVRLICFDISGSGIAFSPGDVASIQPSNLNEDIEDFLNFLSLDGTKQILVRPGQASGPLLPSLLAQLQDSNGVITLRDVVRYYWDLRSIPKRFFFELLSQLSPSDREKERLKDFTLTENQDERYTYANRPRRTILEALQDFPESSKAVSLEYLFDLIPGIKPRSFSIASSHKCSPDELELLVAVVQYKTRLQKERLGLCSNYLARLLPGDTVPLWTKTGTMRFPQRSATGSLPPVIMIGPGTGVAPFRAYLQEAILFSPSDASGGKRDFRLYFGCRREKGDFYCREDYELMRNKEAGLTIRVAFSRDQDEKRYVQHLIAEDASVLWDLIYKQEALLYLAGNAKRMPIDVTDALKAIFLEFGGPEMSDYFGLLERQGRWQVETWS